MSFMHQKLFRFMINVLIIFSGCAQTYASDALYSDTLEVLNQTLEARAKVLPIMMANVLLKVTGDPKVLQRKQIKTIITEAKKYLQQYTYHTQGKLLTLDVKFDKDALNPLILAANIAVWPSPRPHCSIWLAIMDEKGRRILLNQDSHPKYANALAHAAQKRGIPILFPLYDLQDQSKISFTDVWGNFSDPILSLASRYDTPIVIIGKMSKAKQWSIRWSMYYEKKRLTRWTNKDVQVNTVFTKSINSISYHLRQNFAPQNTSITQNTLNLFIQSHSFEHYQRILNHLHDNSLLHNILPVHIESKYMIIQVKINGSADDLFRSMRLSKVLKKSNAGSLNAPNIPGLMYFSIK